MHDTLCICALVPRLETRARLLLVIHRDEARKPTNTGQLAAQCLVNSEVWVRGGVDETATPSLGASPVLLFPREDATPIAAYEGQAVTLVVPDGTWRQAAKVRARVAALRDVPCVSLPPDVPTSYRLRNETQPEGLATMEAIARAFGVLEGPRVREPMERIFRVMVERTLWLRGAMRAEDVTGGVPEAAIEQRKDS